MFNVLSLRRRVVCLVSASCVTMGLWPLGFDRATCRAADDAAAAPPAAAAVEPAAAPSEGAPQPSPPAHRRMPAITDPAKAGPDFQVQGEYAGELRQGDERQRVGVQIVALGDGKFSCAAYRGGLPTAGWDKSDRLINESAAHDGVVDVPLFDGARGVLKDGTITVVGEEGQALGTLTKPCCHCPALGAKPPAGAVVLFDGTSTEALDDGRMTEDGLLMEGCASKQTFGDFRLHLEFRTPFMPYARGQQRGNSGVYLQDRYEIQVLDSFGLEGLDNECGGIYQVAAPAVNACLPPLAWQVYDIDFTAARYQDGAKLSNARVTVRQNGAVIHDDVELPAATPGRKGESPEPGPLYLQSHGNPVRYRNVWIEPR